jgi:integrase
MRLNNDTVKKLSLPDNKKELIVFDDAMPGFGVRLRGGGKRTWIAQYRIGKKQRRITLGTLETVNADDARKRARTALGKVYLGTDPQSEKAEARVQASVTLGIVAADYLARRAAMRLKPRSLADVRRYLTRYWAPLAELPIQSIRRAQISLRLSEIAGTNGPIAANRARAALSTLFSWAIGEGLVEASPVVGTNRAIAEVSRDRVLSDYELRSIWQASADNDYGNIVRLLILTGQRREEVGGMLWSELDLSGARWRMAPSRTKNGLEHEVPLSDAAVEILKSRSRRDNRDLVFGSREGPFQGWSNAKTALDARILEAIRKDLGAKAALKPWRLHDIRRTVATRMADLGVLPHVVEAVLNHISGHKAGVAGVYNRAAYLDEKRAALKRWADHISTLVR